MSRFTDQARSAVVAGFRRQPTASERDVAGALARRGVGRGLLELAGVAADDLPADGPQIGKQSLVSGAVDEARRRGVAYVGTEHLLLALVRRPGSALATRGATADRLDELRSAAVPEKRRANPPLAIRLGRRIRSVVLRLPGRG